jgi:hypothetical protein
MMRSFMMMVSGLALTTSAALFGAGCVSPIEDDEQTTADLATSEHVSAAEQACGGYPNGGYPNGGYPGGFPAIPGLPGGVGVGIGIGFGTGGGLGGSGTGLGIGYGSGSGFGPSW